MFSYSYKPRAPRQRENSRRVPLPLGVSRLSVGAGFHKLEFQSSSVCEGEARLAEHSGKQC